MIVKEQISELGYTLTYSTPAKYYVFEKIENKIVTTLEINIATDEITKTRSKIGAVRHNLQIPLTIKEVQVISDFVKPFDKPINRYKRF